MKKLISSYFLIFVFILSVFYTEVFSQTKGEQPLRHRLIFNCDGTDLLGNFMFHQRPLSLDDLNAYVDAYAGTQVTTFMICSGSDFPYYRSEFGRLFCDDLNGTLNCGSDTANYRYFKSYYLNNLNLEKEGTDMISATLKRVKKDRMEAFITYRMNDLHFSDTTLNCPILYSDFWLKHPEYWLNENIGWNSTEALDFSYREVRQQKLNMITEQLDKYGSLLDGYDLDFMRFIVYFRSGEGRKNAPLITELVKAVRAEVDKQSAKYGKKILLSARVPVSVDDCLDKGLDIKEWINEGLLDFVSIGIHWIGDPAMPVAKFKKDLGNTKIPVYASIDDGGYSPREFYSHGMFRGMASHIFGQGGDGIYLFNFFFGDYRSKYNNQLHLEKEGQVCRVIMPDLLHEIGSPETLRQRNKIYCLDDGNVQYGLRPDTPLPLTVSPGNRSSVNVYVGDNIRKDRPEEIILFFRTDKPARCGIYINGKEVKSENPEYVSLYDKAKNLKDRETVYAFKLPSSCLIHGENEVVFQSSEIDSFTVKRLELALKYGDVKTHGYF